LGPAAAGAGKALGWAHSSLPAEEEVRPGNTRRHIAAVVVEGCRNSLEKPDPGRTARAGVAAAPRVTGSRCLEADPAVKAEDRADVSRRIAVGLCAC